MPSTAEKWQALYNDWMAITKSVKDVIEVMPPFEDDSEKMGMVFQALEGQTELLRNRYRQLQDGVHDAAPTFFEKDLTARYGAIKTCAERMADDAQSAWLMMGSYRDDAKTRSLSDLKSSYDTAKYMIDDLWRKAEPLRDLGRGVTITVKKRRRR